MDSRSDASVQTKTMQRGGPPPSLSSRGLFHFRLGFSSAGWLTNRQTALIGCEGRNGNGMEMENGIMKMEMDMGMGIGMGMVMATELGLERTAIQRQSSAPLHSLGNSDRESTPLSRSWNETRLSARAD